MKPVKPMGASTYNPDRLKLPVYVQPKLDGVRCTTDGKRFFSRNGKPFGPYPHLSLGGRLNAWVDGELYVPGLVLGDIVSIVKRKGHPDLETLEFHAFDLVKDYTPFKHRLDQLCGLLAITDEWTPVRTDFIRTRRQLDEFHKEMGRAGGEGTIIRDPNALYGDGLWKHKFEQDAEFEIIDYKEGKGKDRKTPVFHCIMKGRKNTFWARPVGSLDWRHQLWRDRRELIGLRLTVRFAGYTAEGKPFHPRGLSIRNYE